MTDAKRSALAPRTRPDTRRFGGSGRTQGLFYGAAVLLAVGCSSHSHEAAHDPLAHCRSGFKTDARDGQFPSQSVIETVRRAAPGDPSGDVRDTLMPQPVVDWLYEQGWQQQHDDWHNIRRWDQNCRKSNAPADGCAYAQGLLRRGLWRAPIQEGAPGDGYGFMAMHRHMLQGIRQAFPSHPELFAGFKHVPRSQEDPENPQSWRAVRWTAAQLAAIDKLEHIEQHLGEFPTEDALGLYIELPFRWTPENPSRTVADSSNGIHFSLHAQWSIAGSSAPLGNGPAVINNYVFWKLHGWIDDIWERYRRARGIPNDDPKYTAELVAQCAEMHAADELNLVPQPDPGEPMGPTTAERGLFAEKIRPIFESRCAGCHGSSGQVAALRLGGASSASLIKGLVGVPATNGEYMLVAAGDPSKSWLYLKASGESSAASCTGTCNKGPMPPAGERMTAAELALLEQWIREGAQAPQ